MSKFNKWQYVTDDTISVVGGVPAKRKKITGTRIGAILGNNKWKSDFEIWCEVTKVGEMPFEGSIFTEAGNAIEPKLVEWCKSRVSPHIVTPEQWFGTTKKLYDHFPNETILGGMWDGIVLDKPFNKGGVPIGVIEAKTSQRPQDWVDGVPASYKTQALLYAYLLGVDAVFVPVAFLEPKDYENPEAFECTSKNTYLYELSVANSDIAEQVDYALAWYTRHVLGNVSPKFTARDKKILDVIRTSEVQSSTVEELAQLLTAQENKLEALRVKHGIAESEQVIKDLKERLKEQMLPLLTDTDQCVVGYGYKLSKQERINIDKEKLEADDLLEKYATKSVTYVLKKIKEN